MIHRKHLIPKKLLEILEPLISGAGLEVFPVALGRTKVLLAVISQGQYFKPSAALEDALKGIPGIKCNPESDNFNREWLEVELKPPKKRTTKAMKNELAT